MTQKERIQSMGKDLGLVSDLKDDADEDAEAEYMKSIAKSAGMKDFDSSNSADNDELERRLKAQQESRDRKASNDAARNRATNLATAAGNKVAGPVGGYLAGKAVDRHMRRKNENDEMMRNMLEKNTQRQYERNRGKSGGEQDESSPSSGEEKEKETKKQTEKSEASKPRNDNKKKDPLTDLKAKAKMAKIIVIAVTALSGVLIIIIAIATIIASVQGFFDGFKDALGFNSFISGKTGDLDYDSNDEEQNAFFQRVNDVELELLAKGQQIDSLKIIATYHVLKESGADIDYNSMTESAIKEIAEAQLNGGVYDDSAFKDNLINDIIPKYLPSTTKEEREQIAQSVIDYESDYYEFIDEEKPTIFANCTSSGSCSYDIKGYYIKGKGSYRENIQVNNLYVRLMQCGTANGHNYGGTFGQPLAGEDLVPFEKYILGVAYQEIGADAPAEAVKAQMVAARSYILARHADMGGWRTLKQESGTWILQAASCTQDQVYCDPDKGCSGSDGQWGQVYSGQGHKNGFSRGALPQNSPLRTYINQTSGEVLVNNKGYIIYSGYTSTEQNKMISLAKQGLSYKEILLQVYNQGSRDYGATDIKKAACSSGSITNCGGSTGAFSTWKQAGSSWSNVRMGNSGRTIGQIGCLVTSISMLIAKSGVQTTIPNFNPGTFVQFLNNNGGFDGSGNLQYAPISKAAPSFRWVNQINLKGMSQEQKLNTIRNYQNQGYYMTAEVSTNGQHWVAIDSVNGNTINIMDPGSNVTNLWGSGKYTPQSTKTLNIFKVG